MKNTSMPYILALICFMLFNLSDAWAQSAETRTAERQTMSDCHRKRIDFGKSVINLTQGQKASAEGIERVLKLYPEADLAKHPLSKYTVDTTHVGFLLVGETIPDNVLDKPLRVVNHPDGLDTITLRDYTDDKDWLILDNWADWCTPCVKSMDLWEQLMPQIADRAAVIGVHLDFDYKASVVAKKRKWSSAQIIGGEALVLSRYLMGQQIAGPSVWIHKGKLWGISTIKEKDQQIILDVVDGKLSRIPDEVSWSIMGSLDKEVRDGD